MPSHLSLPNIRRGAALTILNSMSKALILGTRGSDLALKQPQNISKDTRPEWLRLP